MKYSEYHGWICKHINNITNILPRLVGTEATFLQLRLRENMAEAGESQQLISADDEACDLNRDEEMQIVREVLRRTRIQIKTDLKPDDVLYVFLEDMFFGEHTNIKVRDIKEQRTTTEKNDKIIDELARSSQKYVKFKTSLKRTGQDDLLGCIELMENTVHEERGKNVDHVCEAVNKCPLLAQLKSRCNIEPYVPEKVLDLRAVLLDAYEGMFKRIPICMEKTVDLDELYVEQKFKRIDHDRKTEAKGKSEEQTSIASVADILTKKGKICQHILISAEPGLGKSTFCKHLVRLWFKAYTLDEVALTEDQKTLKGFNLLFYIDMSGESIPIKAPKYDEIAELIREHLDLSNSIEDISNVLSDSSVLVVMDSLDELGSSRFPRRGIRNKSCIVTTSRPWKIEALRSTLITDVDQHIEIVGLTEISPLYLANNILKVLNIDSDDRQTKTGDEFIQAMKNEDLQHFLNIPILIIQMLGLFFSGESFGNSQFEIYNKVIHHQILTAFENKELPKVNSNSLKRMFPCCNGCFKQCPCKYYGELLWKMAKMAYHTLFSKDGQMCLVFDHYVTELYELSTEERELCLKIGLLTEHKLLVKHSIKKKKKVSFPHKTYQEYFASIFLSGDGQQSDLDHIREVFSDLDRALELDKVLLFCSENNTAVASQLSRLISEIADNNPSVKEYRHSCDRYDAPHADLIKKIQNIIIPATQQNTQLFLSDIIIKDDEGPQWRRFEGQDRKHFVHYLDLSNIISLQISYPVYETDVQSLKLCKHLQKLVLCDSGIKVEDIHEMVVRNKATLMTLCLAGEEYGPNPNPLDILTLGAQWRDMLTANLSSLGLINVKLSHKQCQDLSTFVATTNNLRQVKLERISCETHEYRGKCFMLDFQRHINLHTVKLTYLPVEDINLKLNIKLHTFDLSNLPVKDIHLHTHSLRSCGIYLDKNVTAQSSIFTALKDASALQELTCVGIDDKSSVILLLDILPNFHNLQRIILGRVEFGDVHNVRLSATMEKLEYVQLSGSTITSAGLRCLINSLPNHNVEVWLWFVRVTDDEKIFQEIRDSPNRNIAMDHGLEKMGDGWASGLFVFDNNNTRPGQA